MANYNFNKDITDGERGEEVVRAELEAEGATFNGNNKNNKYDISMTMPNGRELKFEIKTDVWCYPPKRVITDHGIAEEGGRDSGNIFLEFECRGKASGVMVSEAQIFVYYFPFFQEIWYISFDKLMNIINTQNLRETSWSGDENSNTKGYLLPREYYRTHFKVKKTDYKWER